MRKNRSLQGLRRQVKGLIFSEAFQDDLTGISPVGGLQIEIPVGVVSV